MKSVLIVCEAGKGKGLGHFYRSVALAQILADDYQIRLLSNGFNLPDCGFKLIQSSDFKDVECLKDTDLVILDGYAFSSVFISHLEGSTIPFVEISDFESQLYPAKFWINSSVNDQQIPGRGLNYSLLRKEILEVAKIKEFQSKKLNSLFIAYGGTDERSHSLDVIEQLLPTGFFKRIGVLYPKTGKDFTTLENLGSKHPELKIFSDLSTSGLIKTTDDFSLTLVSSSTIACEMVALRKIVFTCCLYENQELLHQQLVENKAAIEIVLQNVIADPQTFIRQIHEAINQQAIFEQQKKLIDGLAPERIRNFIANCLE